MTRLETVLRLLPVVVTAATPAMAQQVGTYVGQMADGNPISFYVQRDTSTDPFTVNLQVTNFFINAMDICKPGSFGLSFNEGFGIPGPGFSGRRGSYGFSDNSTYVSATMVFSGNTVSGTVFNEGATLVPPTTSGAVPRKAALCSAKLSYTATFSSSSAALHPAVVHYGR